MKIAIQPMMSPDGAPLVRLLIGDECTELTTMQAEDLALTLFRAATASRYEAAITEVEGEHSGCVMPDEYVELTRQAIGNRRMSQG